MKWRCVSCAYRTVDGYCTNREKIHEDDYDHRDEDKSDHLVYSYFECGAFLVGEDFGCVHWTNKTEEDPELSGEE